MKEFIAITKALSDESRARALMSLVDGELCLCQIIELLQLSPSTVSKHMTLLHQAGLVERRKQGRWHYYRLAGDDAPPEVREAIAWALKSLAKEKIVIADAKNLCCVRTIDIKELASCYNPK